MSNIKCEGIDLRVPNKCLLENTDLIISEGSKYALIGHNGTGKTTLLKHIAEKAWPTIPNDLNVYYVEQEVEATNISVFQTVIDANIERKKLIEKYDALKTLVENSESVSNKDFIKYQQTMEELKIMGVDKDESVVRYLLFGLGFSNSDQDRMTSEFSGGWRMRISLAKGLYLKPKLLLLDEPTNHLDLNAVMWLTSFLRDNWKNTLIVISHDKNFINEVCDNVIHLDKQKLNYYKGNYDNFLKTKKENERHSEKEWSKIEKKVNELKKNGSKKDIIHKLLEGNKYLKPNKPYRVRLAFTEPSNLNFKGKPVIEIENLTFGYDNDKLLFDDITLGIDLDTRVAIVGKNGVGKTTFIKTILGLIKPTSGSVSIDSRVKIGYYNQHAAEILPLDKTPVEYLLSIDGSIGTGTHGARAFLGSIGLEGNLHNTEMKTFSGGQKARVVFCKLFVEKPHVIFLDEPTNHIDLETIDALIEAINNFKGAIIMITHNVDLIEQTKAHLWELENGQIIESNYDDYHEKVINEINLLLE